MVCLKKDEKIESWFPPKQYLVAKNYRSPQYFLYYLFAYIKPKENLFEYKRIYFAYLIDFEFWKTTKRFIRFGEMDGISITVNGIICTVLLNMTKSGKSPKKKHKKIALTIRMNKSITTACAANHYKELYIYASNICIVTLFVRSCHKNIYNLIINHILSQC